MGGARSDVAVIYAGQTVRGKALTTYDALSRGVLDATAVAADKLGMEPSESSGKTRLLIDGTTVVTNAITQLRASRVGVLITAGFRDAFRFAAGPRLAEFDDLQKNMPDLVNRDDISEIRERIDYAGGVLLNLDLEAAPKHPRDSGRGPARRPPVKRENPGARIDVGEA